MIPGRVGVDVANFPLDVIVVSAEATSLDT